MGLGKVKKFALGTMYKNISDNRYNKSRQENN